MSRVTKGFKIVGTHNARIKNIKSKATDGLERISKTKCYWWIKCANHRHLTNVIKTANEFHAMLFAQPRFLWFYFSVWSNRREFATTLFVFINENVIFIVKINAIIMFEWMLSLSAAFGISKNHNYVSRESWFWSRNAMQWNEATANGQTPHRLDAVRIFYTVDNKCIDKSGFSFIRMCAWAQQNDFLACIFKRLFVFAFDTIRSQICASHPSAV